MSKICQVCAKKSSTGHSVSHSHRRTKRKWRPNLQKVRAVVDGAAGRIVVCASCIKAGRVRKP